MMLPQDNNQQNENFWHQARRLWHKLGGTIHIIVAIVLFASVGLAVTYAISAAELKDEETVVLANGVEIRLGESLNSLDSKIGESSQITRDKKIYQYPKPFEGQPVEVLVFTDTNKVIAIQIISNSANIIKNSEESVDLTRDSLLRRLEDGENRRSRRGSRLETVGETANIRKNLRRSRTYYVFDLCNQPKTVNNIALAYPAAEDILRVDTDVDCHEEVD